MASTNSNPPLMQDAALSVHLRRINVEEVDVVGFEDKIEILVSRLTGDKRDFDVLSIIGMGGSGKTTLARKIYNDTRVKNHFNCCAFVYVSQEYNSRNLLVDILNLVKTKSGDQTSAKANSQKNEASDKSGDKKEPADKSGDKKDSDYQKNEASAKSGGKKDPADKSGDKKDSDYQKNEASANKSGDKKDPADKSGDKKDPDYHKNEASAKSGDKKDPAAKRPSEMSHVELQYELRKCLEGKKYLVVMDDIWKPQVWKEVMNAFPENNNGSRILITSRDKDIASRASSTPPYNLDKLDEEASRKLLRKKVFRGKECTEDWKKLEKQLAESCKGLPLSIVVLGGILAKKEKSYGTWCRILEEKVNSYLMEDCGDSCFEILALSYDQLPYKLKSCFLYLGVFSEDFEIPAKDLTNLWIAEGFVDQIGNRKVDSVARSYLEELIDRSLIQVASRSSDGSVKTCRIHDLLRDLCLKLSVEEKFYEVHSSEANLSSRSKARRLSVHCDQASDQYMISSSASSARSLLFFGQGARYFFKKDWVWICDCFKFIRVLLLFNVAKSIPEQIGKLIYLKYFGIGFRKKSEYFISPSIDEAIPNSICNLEFLETIDIRCVVEDGLWPKNIWRMKQLRHLYAGGVMKFPDIPQSQTEKAEFCNLQVLSDIYADRKSAFYIAESKFPNLTELGLYYDYWNPDSHHPMKVSKMTEILRNLKKLPHLQKLRITGFPKCKADSVTLPSTLIKVSLVNSYVDSNLMEILGKLPNLSSLKIYARENVFPKRLHVFAGQFPELLLFKMHCCEDIERWELERDAMPKLQTLVIYENESLKTLPDVLWSSLRLVKLSDISASLAESVIGEPYVESDYDNTREFYRPDNNGCKILITDAYY